MSLTDGVSCIASSTVYVFIVEMSNEVCSELQGNRVSITIQSPIVFPRYLLFTLFLATALDNQLKFIVYDYRR